MENEKNPGRETEPVTEKNTELTEENAASAEETAAEAVPAEEQQEHHPKSRKKAGGVSKKFKILYLAVLLILLGVIGYSGYKVISQLMVYREAENAYEDLLQQLLDMQNQIPSSGESLIDPESRTDEPAPTDPSVTEPVSSKTLPDDTDAPVPSSSSNAETPKPTDPPATELPPTDPPVTEPQPTDPPATEPQPTDPPATQPPATQPPATQPPATQPPATQPPATQPPATQPVTQRPTTAPTQRPTTAPTQKPTQPYVPTEGVSVDAPHTQVTDTLEWMPINVRSLQDHYPEMIAYLQGQSGAVTLPVMQGGDNEYYLTHLYNGVPNGCGALFVDARNHFLQDDVTLIYGHHMRNGSMFGQLEKYKTQSYYNSNKTFHLYTANGNYVLEVMAAVYTNAREGFYFNYYTEENYRNAVADYKARSLIKTNVTPVYGDKLVILYTCSYQESDGRFLVICRVAS